MHAGRVWRLDLGAGDHKTPGFTTIDKYDETADIQADICALPFDADSVDEIKCIQVIEHIPYWQSAKVFEEMHRVLKPGGFAIIETPDIDYVCQAILDEGLQDKWIYNLVGEYYRPWDKQRYADWENYAGAIHRNPWNLERIARFAKGFKLELDDDKEYDYPENLRVKLTK